jgi:hypothetical protein
VNVRVPTKDPPEVKVNPPFAASDSEPLPPSSTGWAVRESPSGSSSLPSTPGPATVSFTPVVAVYESFAAVGAAFVTVNVTVAESVRRTPRLKTRASYLNESGPT